MSRPALVWTFTGLAIVLPTAQSLASPLLAWRDATYIAAGLAGVLSLGILLLQPLLAGGVLPLKSLQQARRIHCWTGTALVAAVLIHVIGLWITSPPDVIDAFLFRSATPFSMWGVIALWAVLTAAVFAVMRKRLQRKRMIGYRGWQRIHVALAGTIVVTTVVHALLIDGTMDQVSKLALCLLVLAATAVTIATVIFGSTNGKTNER